MNTCYSTDYTHVLHTITPDDDHRISVRQIIDAIDAWVEYNLRTEHGLEINGNEIYWIDYAMAHLGQRVQAHTGPLPGPLLRLGIRPGSNEGWILLAYVDGRITPILTAKLWTLDAAAQLMAALTRASADCIA